ncbi:hypothetical protein RDWZM_004938 [Blomia tropicalis]|uniref:Uncharacterized protein n=1 Tax=Blomia tropicalis TaxID=40697 RepID=A0A9Q0RLW5_BLOTA|nr:hypothetical protein RDWZM_004938 [Blomia tropicalis]
MVSSNLSKIFFTVLVTIYIIVQMSSIVIANSEHKIDCRRIIFHPYCRGISAKRANLQMSPDDPSNDPDNIEPQNEREEMIVSGRNNPSWERFVPSSLNNDKNDDYRSRIPARIYGQHRPDQHEGTNYGTYAAELAGGRDVVANHNVNGNYYYRNSMIPIPNRFYGHEMDHSPQYSLYNRRLSDYLRNQARHNRLVYGRSNDRLNRVIPRQQSFGTAPYDLSYSPYEVQTF